MCKVDDTFDDICISLQRIITAHNYYISLNIQTNKNNEEIFIKFIQEIYGKSHILNDYEHLMKIHKHNIYEINKIMTSTAKSPLISKCILSQCKASSRHYSRDEADDGYNKSQNNEEIDWILSFYCHLFDSVHFLLMHALETGMRIIPKRYRNEEKDDKTDDEQKGHDIYFDAEFRRIANEINRKQQATSMFNRYKQNKKFNIGFNDKSQTGLPFIIFSHHHYTKC